MTGNVIVGQSGGPTAAINSSLAGVFRTAKDRGAGKVYGMLHGIKGLMEEDYIDLIPILINLRFDPVMFLKNIDEVKIQYD